MRASDIGILAVAGLFVLSAPAMEMEPPSVARARTLFESGDFESSLAMARGIIRTAPGDASAHLVAGASLLNLGRVDEAERFLERARQLDGDLPLVRHQLGLLTVERAKVETRSRRKSSLYADAARWFDRELAVNPGACPVLESRVRARMAAERDHAALEEIEEWVEACPRNETGWVLLARHYVGAGKRDRLGTLSDRVPKDLPRARAAMRWYAASGFLLSGERERAVTELRALAEGDPREAERLAADAAARALEGSYNEADSVFGRLVRERSLDSWSTDEPLFVLALSMLQAPLEGAEGLWACIAREFDGPCFEYGDRVVDVYLPVLEHKMEPEYPPGMRADRREGAVAFSGFVTKVGRFIPVRVAQSTGPAFTNAALNCVVRWRYVPGTLDGEIVDFRYAVLVSFRLR